MKKSFLLLLLFLLIFSIYSNTVDPLKLKKEISKLNDQHKYDHSIIQLENIINHPSSTPHDRFYAYVQKSRTYKRLFNYSAALKNLEQAAAHIDDKIAYKNKLESQLLAEKILIYFDLQEEDKFTHLMQSMTEEKLAYLDLETKAYYVSILGILSFRKGDYVQSDKYLDEAIVLLKQDSPKNLPNVYRTKLLLYNKMKNHEKALQAFETGLAYAEEYKMDIYRIFMYESITQYYKELGDYENAFHNQLMVSKYRTQYNANNVSGSINELEMELLAHRNTIEMGHEKKYRSYPVVISVVLILLIITLGKLLLVSKQKRILAEQEINYIRNEVRMLSTEKKSKTYTSQDLKSFGLTTRQLEIVELVQQGKTNKQIGELLFISENTVKYHLKQIFQILGVEGRIELKNKQV